MEQSGFLMHQVGKFIWPDHGVIFFLFLWTKTKNIYELRDKMTCGIQLLTTSFLFISFVHIIYPYPAGTERRPNQSWTNIISVQGRTNPEPILNQSYGLIRSATVRLWFTYVWRIRSLFGSAEPILNQKCLQGSYPFSSGCTTVQWVRAALVPSLGDWQRAQVLTRYLLLKRAQIRDIPYIKWAYKTTNVSRLISKIRKVMRPWVGSKINIAIDSQTLIAGHVIWHGHFCKEW